jgi:hypothetical protein
MELLFTVVVYYCLLLQDLAQSCSGGGRGIVEDMCYDVVELDGPTME